MTIELLGLGILKQNLLQSNVNLQKRNPEGYVIKNVERVFMLSAVVSVVPTVLLDLVRI